MNHISAENFMRSAKLPQISAGVMMAKVIWNVMKTDSGIVPITERSEEHTSELQSLMRISYAVFCLKKKKTTSIIKLDTLFEYLECNRSNTNKTMTRLHI